MRNDYEPYFQNLRGKLSALGYSAVRESYLEAQFVLYSGWTLSFECERYYAPMFGIYIIPPNPSARKNRYEVGLLMQVFEKLQGKSYGKPTIDAQVDFLVEEKDRVFGDPALYEAEYASLNNFPAP